MSEDKSAPEILQFFAYEHLPPHLRQASQPFAELAQTLADTYRPTAELSVALRKLLEAKDAAVRAALLHVRLAGTP